MRYINLFQRLVLDAWISYLFGGNEVITHDVRVKYAFYRERELQSSCGKQTAHGSIRRVSRQCQNVTV